MSQKGIYTLPRRVRIASAASAAGKSEASGPFSGCFDITEDQCGGDADTFGMKSWETAESEMQRLTLTAAIKKAGIGEHDLDAVFAGDLQNQCVGSSYGIRSFDVPFFGVYGACSTCAETLILASAMCAGGLASRCAAVASSHNCAAERQFRTPVEYGGQRPPTAQWTVTGAGAFIVEDPAACGERKDGAFIVDFMPGRIVDRGINDQNNMGAAMAPSAVDTLSRYFTESGRSPDSFDMIVTGDLGAEGSRILCEFLTAAGYDITGTHSDCGLMIYDREGTDKHAGGSGCGCSAAVLACHILPRISEIYGKRSASPLRDILFLATGALMSPSSIQQGCTIPGICHLLHITQGA